MDVYVRYDKVVRNVNIEIKDAEPVIIPWMGKILAPDRLHIKITRDFLSVETSGPLVLKSGKLSESRRESVFWYNREKLDETAPEWIIELVNRVVGGDLTS